MTLTFRNIIAPCAIHLLWLYLGTLSPSWTIAGHIVVVRLRTSTWSTSYGETTDERWRRSVKAGCRSEPDVLTDREVVVPPSWSTLLLIDGCRWCVLTIGLGPCSAHCAGARWRTHVLVLYRPLSSLPHSSVISIRISKTDMASKCINELFIIYHLKTSSTSTSSWS